MPAFITLNGFSAGTKCIRQRPQCAIQVAAVIAEWAYLEDTMVLLFSASMGTHTVVDDKGSVSLNRNWVALSTLQEINSLKMTLNIIKKTLIILLADNLKAQWKELEKSIWKAGDIRNTIAHATWGISDKYPSDIILQDAQGRYVLYTEADLIDSLDFISSVRADTYNFMHSVLLAQRENKTSIPKR